MWTFGDAFLCGVWVGGGGKTCRAGVGGEAGRKKEEKGGQKKMVCVGGFASSFTQAQKHTTESFGSSSRETKRNVFCRGVFVFFFFYVVQRKKKSVPCMGRMRGGQSFVRIPRQGDDRCNADVHDIIRAPIALQNTRA